MANNNNDYHPFAGKVSSLEVAEYDTDTSDYGEFEKVGGRVDWNFNIDKTEIDGSHMDVPGGWSVFLQGRKNATIGGTLRYIEGNEGQAILFANAYEDGDKLKFKFSLTDEEEAKEWEAEGFVTNVNPTPTDEDVTNMSWTARLDAIEEVE